MLKDWTNDYKLFMGHMPQGLISRLGILPLVVEGVKAVQNRFENSIETVWELYRTNLETAWNRERTNMESI